jgi:hypothetical protein
MDGLADNAPVHADVHLLSHKAGVVLWEVWLPAPPQSFDAVRWITWLDPDDVRTQMKKIESGSFTPADIDLFQDLQWAYAKKLVGRPSIESADVTEIPDYVWPKPPCKDMGKRRDNDYKNAPEAH